MANTAQVYDQQGTVYQAVQLQQETVINGFRYPAGWWQVTDPYNNTSAVSPAAFNQMFSPAQGIYLLGQPGGAAQLNNNGLVVQHSQYEGQPGGVATLKSDGTLQQTSGLVITSMLGVPNGVPTLDANTRVIQRPAKGVCQKAAWFNSAYGTITTTTTTDIYANKSSGWSGSSAGPFSLTTQAGLLLVRAMFMGVSNYYTNLSYTTTVSVKVDTTTIAVGQATPQNTGVVDVVKGTVVAVPAGTHTISIVLNNGGTAGTWNINCILVEIEEIGG